MNIYNMDLDFLIQLEHTLWDENHIAEVSYLIEMTQRLIRQRDKGREKARKFVAERRKTDKNYARSKGEINHG